MKSRSRTLTAGTGWGPLPVEGPPAACAPRHRDARAQTARFFSLRRSRSESPPQSPKRSSFISADSRHSSRTSHVRQTFLASLVDPPFSGKNASGSVCAHSARSCHPASSASPSRRKSSLTALALSTRYYTRPTGPRRADILIGRKRKHLRRTLWELHACRTPEVKRASAIEHNHPNGLLLVGPKAPCAKIGTMQNITVLSGGVGGARFLQGLLHGIAAGSLPGVPRDASVTVVANTADDIWVHGLKVCPDLDTVMYTLGDGIDLDRGWGRREETWSVKTELAEYGVEPTWFGLGDRDVATHLVRTQMLDAGYPLSEVTEALCRRWRPGVRLLPMTDDRVETHVAIADPDSPSGRRVVHFQEYWVRLRAAVPAEAVVVVGLEESTPGPGVIDAITDADLILLPPSNPVVSVGTILGVPRVREAVAATRAPVVGLSPIVGGTHVRGMAHQMLTAIGVEVSAAAVGLHYGARAEGGVLDGWLVDTVDASDVARVRDAGLVCTAVPLLMTSPEATAEMAVAALGLVT